MVYACLAHLGIDVLELMVSQFNAVEMLVSNFHIKVQVHVLHAQQDFTVHQSLIYQKYVLKEPTLT